MYDVSILLHKVLVLIIGEVVSEKVWLKEKVSTISLAKMAACLN